MNIDIVVLAVSHSLVAASTLGINLFVTQRRQMASAKSDARKFRLAVAAELASLRDLYKDNVDALYAGRDVLASSRLFQGVYRGNLGRLHILADGEIPAIVAGYAASERAEALAAAHGRPHGQSAFSLGKERPFTDEMVAAYERASAAAERALRAMSQTEACLYGQAESSAVLDGAAKIEAPREAAA